MERDHDRRVFMDSVQARSLAERVEAGMSWFPVVATQTGFALGDRVYVVVERTEGAHRPHQLKAGQSVRFFCDLPHIKHGACTGIIQHLDRHKMKIILQSRDLPEWIPMGRLGVDLLFDERSYQEMDAALETVMQSGDARVQALRDMLAGGSSQTQENKPIFLPASSETLGGEGLSEALNPAQRRAINGILRASHLAIIHGPPGTGKTTTLVALVKELVREEPTILVCAPSNAAADLLTERLAVSGMEVVRVGNTSRVDERLLPFTLDARVASHPGSRDIRKVKLAAMDYRRKAERFRRHFGGEERRERASYYREAGELEAWARVLEERLLDDILSGAQAITCTLVGAAHPVLHRYHFRTCIIDEAAQALEAATWIPILKASRVILAGDPYQLPPTIKCQEAAAAGMAETLMERCLIKFPEAVFLLDVQYRMHHLIMDFPNRWFYGGRLQAAADVGTCRLLSVNKDDGTLTVLPPIVFVDTAGADFEEQTRTEKNAPGRYNPEEGLLIREHLLRLIACFGIDKCPEIALLSPYREQVYYLEAMLKEDPFFHPLLPALQRQKRVEPEHPGRIIVQTIDGFQGQEREVVYISLVRSNKKQEIGFLHDFRRMNVAMTRARKMLVVVGDSSTIGNSPFFHAFLNYCSDFGTYKTAFEYLR
jgi:superfamily I DNA and/or RNA helicase